MRHIVARAMLASVSHTLVRGLKGDLFSKRRKSGHFLRDNCTFLVVKIIVWTVKSIALLITWCSVASDAR